MKLKVFDENEKCQDMLFVILQFYVLDFESRGFMV